ncbi:hypothetical protein PI124_g23356 [Phytophthora idaei]|nr:hypothetical protein PI125_g25473 [Phytophthora idaei]KAG3124166.1 hypothetical protein PI126_g23370 [Phytophthora idaei]KAG3231544.1 hypothetical protein PI124_g23356 [Phytophthora idaei]
MPSLAGVHAPQLSTELARAVVLGLGRAVANAPRRTHQVASAKPLPPPSAFRITSSLPLTAAFNNRERVLSESLVGVHHSYSSDHFVAH